MVKRGAIRFHCCFEIERFTGIHYTHAMVPDGAINYYDITWMYVQGFAYLNVFFLHPAYSGGINKDFITFPLVNDFGIASYNHYTGFFSLSCQRFNYSFQVTHRKTFFNDK